jgi:Carboxypeptidase regulatory-like domain/TonB dependent receptor
MKNLTLTSLLLLILLALLALPTQVNAQGVTSSSLSGVITDASGSPVVGADISAVDTSSGTKYSAVSRGGGRWDIANVRTGGPFRITASANGQSKTRSGIYTTLQQTTEVDIQLSAGAGPQAPATTTTTTTEAGAATTERVTVQGASVEELYSSDRNGTSTYVDRQQISNLPTITRSLNDYIRLTPQISTLGRQGASAAGQNNRSNNIQIDGATISDAFGLATTGGGTGAPTESAEPISLDMIDQFRVNIAPFDVRESNFSGASINGITRSGGNQFHGAAYGFWRDENLVGDGSPIRQPIAAFHENTYGAWLSGPIFKDVLFFVLSYEGKRATTPILGDVSKFIPHFTGDGSAADTSIQHIIDITRTQYPVGAPGFDPGSIGSESTTINDDKYFMKLDWNILPGHHASLTYNHVDGTNQFGLQRGTTYDLHSRQYTKPIHFDSMSFQVFDTWNPSLSTESIFVFNNTSAERVPQGLFPQVIVHETYGDVRLGSEQFSQENFLNQEVISETFNANYFIGNHQITVGTQEELLEFKNKFLRDFFGAYDFRATPGFTATQNYQRGAPSNYSVTFPTVAGSIPITEVRLWDLSLYAQDKWKIRENLNITYGLRFDTHVFPDDPFDNPKFAAAFPGRSTSQVDDDYVLGPRIGFNWDVFNNKNTQVRGGTGIFGTRTLGVLYTNQYGGTGVDFQRITQNFSTPPVGFFTGKFNPPPPPPAGQPVVPEIDLNDHDFKTPQIWRSSLAVDQKIPFGLIFTAEGLFGKNIEAVTERNLNLGKFTGFRSEDDRPIFNGAKPSTQFGNVILLANTHSGYTYNLTGQLERPDPGDGWYGKVAYTYGRAYDVNSTTSSQAASNFGFNPTSGYVNNDVLSTSDFELRHRFLAVLTYTHAIWKGWDTTIGAVYEGASGHPYSVLYNGDANGDGQFSNDLIYVPTGLNDPIGQLFRAPGTNPTAAQNLANFKAFNDYIDQNPFLRRYRGKIAPRNGGRDPWINRLDLHFSQKIPVKWVSAEITADILNFGNLLDSNWGQIKRYSTFGTPQPVTLSSAGLYTYTGVGSKATVQSDQDLDSRWKIQLGCRISF